MLRERFDGRVSSAFVVGRRTVDLCNAGIFLMVGRTCVGFLLRGMSNSGPVDV